MANPTNLIICFIAHLTYRPRDGACTEPGRDHHGAIESMIRGHHEYKHVWENPSEDDELVCEREIGNAHDTHTVAIRKDIDGETRIVGHVPRKISLLCSIFIRRVGMICCRVNGHRHYSHDLPQGVLEVPCILTYITREEKEWTKTKKLIQSALGIEMLRESQEEMASHVAADRARALPTAVASISLMEEDPVVDLTESNRKVDQSPPRRRHKKFCEEAIIMGQELSDVDINFAQHLLKVQYPKLNGLRSTLLQDKKATHTENSISNNIQIIYCQGRHHWITVTTVNCKAGEVKVFDLAFSFCDRETIRVINNFFTTDSMHTPTLTMGRCQKQKGGKDCRLFSIAFATALAFRSHPSKLKFDQSMMRQHLVNCFNKEYMIPFPCQ